MITLPMSKNFCKSCGNHILIEKEIEDMTGATLTLCLECVNKATAIILRKRLNRVQDARVRQELRKRLTDINGLC